MADIGAFEEEIESRKDQRGYPEKKKTKGIKISRGKKKKKGIIRIFRKRRRRRKRGQDVPRKLPKEEESKCSRLCSC